MGHPRGASTSQKPSQPTKARVCLSCEREFLSTGPGNRICLKCQGARRAQRDVVLDKNRNAVE